VWRHDYDQQPPFGFRNFVYFGETHNCVPLHDPCGAIAELKTEVSKYPAALKTTILTDGFWGVEFTIWAREGYLASGDVFNAAGCMTRAAQYLIRALFALNEEYFLSDKHAMGILSGLAWIPREVVPRLNDALVRHSLAEIRRLWAESVALTDGAYVPRFDLTAFKVESSSS